MSDKVKFSANVPQAVFETLQEIADERDSTITDAIKVVIATERYVRDVRKRGGKILIAEADGQTKEVVFR